MKHPEHTPQKNKTSYGWSLFIVLSACALAFSTRFFILKGLPPVEQPDTKSYEDLLKTDVLKNIFFQRRSGGYPLFIKLLGFDRGLIVLSQRVISGLAWIALSLAVACRMRSPLSRWGAAISLFMLGCCPFIIWWDVKLMTESMSISAFVFIVAIVLHWNSYQKGIGELILILMLVFYFCMLHTINIYVLPALALYFILLEIKALRNGELIYGLKSYPRTTLIRIIIILLIPASFLFFKNESIMGKRWRLALMDSLQCRILAQRGVDQILLLHEGNFKYFVEHYQMPAEEAFRRLGLKGWEKPRTPTPAYDAWLSQKGYGAYVDFLIHHPRNVLHEYVNIGILYSFNGLWDVAQWRGWREGFDFRRFKKLAFIEGIYQHSVGVLVHLRYSYPLMNLVLIFLAAWWNRAYDDRGSASVPPELVATCAILFCVAPLIAVVAWLSDEDSLFRHSVIGMVAYYVGAVTLFWTILDWLIIKLRPYTASKCHMP